MLRQIFRAILTLRNGSEGGVAIVFALAVIPLVFAIGIGIDYGLAFKSEQKLQDALDNALLAGARESEPELRRSKASEFFTANLGELANYKAKIAVEAVGADTLNGTATARMPTTFTGIMGIEGIDIAAKASVSIGAQGGPCVTLVSPNASNALLVNSGADINAPECEFHVHSTGNPAAVINAGISLKLARICVKGTNILNNYGKLDSLAPGCSPLPDPYANKLQMPDSSVCDYSSLNFNGGSHTLSPGVYCGWTNFNAGPSITFKPGVYVIKSGGWNVNGGTWSGSDVSFFFADTSMIQFNSGVSAKLTPPASGTYAGLMIFEKDGLSQSNFVLDDSKDFEISGIVHLPSRNTIFNSGSQVHTRALTMVFNTLILDQTKWKLSGWDTKPTSGSTVVRLTR